MGSATAKATGGILPMGGGIKYSYVVTGVEGGGETPPSAVATTSSIATSSSGSVTLKWNAEVGASAYRIYGRTYNGTDMSTIKLIAEVPSTVNELNQPGSQFTWTDDGRTTPSNALPSTDTTQQVLCSAFDSNAVDNLLCRTTQLALNDNDTGQANLVFAADRATNYSYGLDGQPVLSDVVMPGSGGDLKTTYGYGYQYWDSAGDVVATGTHPTGSGNVSTPAFSSSDTLFTISDKTAMLPPRGNAAGGSYAPYETIYDSDDLSKVTDQQSQVTTYYPPNTVAGSGDPAGLSVCSTDGGTSGGKAGKPTANTGLMCEVDTPTPARASDAGGVSNCQAVDLAFAAVCTTYTYNGWGEKTSMTTPLAHTDDLGSANKFAAYHYVYYADTDTDVATATPSGGWLKAVVDPIAKKDDTVTDLSGLTQHFVVFGYDAAGNTVLTWDRYAVQRNTAADIAKGGTHDGIELSSYTPSESGGAPASGNQPGYSYQTYGSANYGASSSRDLFAKPWRYVVKSATAETSADPTVAPFEAPAPNYTTAPNETTVIVVDGNGNPTSITDPLGNATVNTYDAIDELKTSSTHAKTAGEKTTYVYDGDGNPITITSPNGQSGVAITTGNSPGFSTHIVYNALDLPIQTVTPRLANGDAGANLPAPFKGDKCSQGIGGYDALYDCQTVTVYDGFGEPVETIDGNNHVVYSFYDAAGRKIARSVSYGQPTSALNQADLNSQGTRSATPTGADYLNSAWVYDQDGNITKTCTPRDFDPNGGNAKAADNSTPGTSAPSTSAKLDTLTGACSNNVPLYGSTSTYGNADETTSVSKYRAPGSPATPDGTTVPSGTKALTTTSTYDADGNTVNVLDPAGTAGVAPNQASHVAMKYTYDSLDRKVCQSMPRLTSGLPAVPSDCTRTATQSAYTVTHYNDSGDVESVEAPKGDSASSAGGNLSRRSDTMYDLDHRVVATIAGATSADPFSTYLADKANQQDLRTGYYYDAGGNLIQQFDPRAYARANALKAPATRTDSNGPDPDYSVIIRYDGNHHPTKILSPRADSTLAHQSQPEGSQCPTSNAPTGSDVYKAFPTSPTTSVCETDVTYDRNGNRWTILLPTQVSGGQQPTVSYTYTYDDLLSSTATPSPTGTGSSTTTTYYDGDAQPVKTVDPDTKTTWTKYTGNELPYDVADADPNAIAPAKLLHHAITAYDANGATITSAGLVSNTGGWPNIGGSDGGGSWQVTTTAINSDGTTQTSTNTSRSMNGDTTTYDYDLNGNPTKIYSPKGSPPPASPTTVNTYTADNLLATSARSVTTSDSRTTSYTYDPAGRKEKQAIADGSLGAGGNLQFTYYPTDEPASQTGRDPSAAGNTTTTGTPDTFANGSGTVSFGYDEAGNQSTVNDSANYGGGSGSYGSSITNYYTLDSLLAETDEGPNADYLRYDGSGSVTMRTSQIGATRNQWIHFTNGPSGLPTAADTNQASGHWSFNYDSAGLLTDATYPDGEALHNNYYTGANNAATNYDSEMLKDTTLTSGVNTLQKFAYSYDGLDRIKTQNDQRAGGKLYTFSYDPQGRICQFDDGSATASTRNITWDADGNRTAFGNVGEENGCQGTGSNLTGSSTTTNYNLDDTIKTIGATSVAYDAAGRLTNDGVNNYCYDGFDQTELVGAASDTSCTTSVGTTYAYDGLSRQASSTKNSNTSKYLYDGTSSSLLTDSRSQGTAHGAINYLLSPTDAPLAIADDTNSGNITQYLTDDGAGNIGAVTDATTHLALCNPRYDPFGTLLPPAAGVPAPPASCPAYVGTLYYGANRRDANTGNYQDGARTYNPTLDAFTTADSYGPGDGSDDQSIGVDPLTANTYTYVNGDPINYDDPTGHYQAADTGAKPAAHGAVAPTYAQIVWELKYEEQQREEQIVHDLMSQVNSWSGCWSCIGSNLSQAGHDIASTATGVYNGAKNLASSCASGHWGTCGKGLGAIAIGVAAAFACPETAGATCALLAAGAAGAGGGALTCNGDSTANCAGKGALIGGLTFGIVKGGGAIRGVAGGAATNADAQALLGSIRQAGKTAGVLNIDGDLMPLVSRKSSLPNYAASGHVEGQAALIMRERGVSSAELLIDNPNGICSYCTSQVPTLLPEGAQLMVRPPLGTVPTQWWFNGRTFLGNAANPKPSPW